MKKRLMSLALLTVFLLGAVYGQSNSNDNSEYLVIEQTDGSTLRLDISKIVQMYFKPSATLAVNPTSVTLNSDKGSTARVTISSNTSWTVSGVPSWLTVSPTSGTGNKELTLTTKEQNTGTTDRTARLQVKTTEDNKTAEISISQKNAGVNIYKEPYIVWGASKSQTKSFMSGYTLYSEDDTSLAYYGKYKETLVLYSFKSGQLTTAAVAVTFSAASLSDVDAKLKQDGYSYKGNADGARLYLSADEKTAVALETGESAYYIYYYPYNSQSTTTYYEEPYLSWGTARSTVKSQVNKMGYELMAESLSASSYYYLAYSPKHKETYTQYLFDSSQRLDDVLVVFDESVASVADLRDYISGTLGHTYRGTNAAGDQYFYLTKDGASYAIVYAYTTSSGVKTTGVEYVSYSSVSSSVRQKARGANEADAIVYERIKPLAIPKDAALDTGVPLRISLSDKAKVKALFKKLINK